MAALIVVLCLHVFLIVSDLFQFVEGFKELGPEIGESKAKHTYMPKHATCSLQIHSDIQSPRNKTSSDCAMPFALTRNLYGGPKDLSSGKHKLTTM